jgi:DNA invertase Pin-like site-specific DNA recombinase
VRARKLIKGRKNVSLALNSNQIQALRELFDAHIPINEIADQTGLTIDMVVHALNAPRKQHSEARGMLSPQSEV